MNIKDYSYTPLFCEENIWLLANSLRQEGVSLKQLQVLLLSNVNKQIVLFEQKSAPLGKAAVWDYHVILWLEREPHSLIFDFDSRLPFPCPASQYFHSSFPNPEHLPPQYHYYIRQIPGADYLKYFYSNREHMQRHIPQQHFPQYPIIQPAEGVAKISLSEYWDMEKQLPDHSEIYPYYEIFSRLVSHTPSN